MLRVSVVAAILLVACKGYERLVHRKGPDLDVTRAPLAGLFSDAQLALATKKLSPADADALKTSQTVILLRGSGTDGMKLAKEVAGVARDVADAAHGWVLDPETLQAYSAATFHDHVPTDHPDVRKLIVVHVVMGDNEPPFLDSAGLHRYGLPDLYFPEAATGQIDPIMHLINGAAQTLLDGQDVDDRGEIAIDFHKLGWNTDIIARGTGKAIWKTRWGEGARRRSR